jgi:hypothetical protein
VDPLNFSESGWWGRILSAMKTPNKKTWNISGCEITVVFDQSQYHQGDTINCSVSVTFNKSVNVKTMMIAIQEWWKASTGSGDSLTYYTERKDRVIKVLIDDMEIEKGNTYDYEFTGQLPDNCRLSLPSEDTIQRGGWKLFVAVDSPPAEEQIEGIDLKVKPYREFTAVYNAIESDLNFTHQTKFMIDYFVGLNRNYRRYIPPESLSSELDCMDVTLSQSGEMTKCELIFDLQEKSLKDYAKMVVKQDKVKRNIQFSSDEIFDNEKNVNAKMISQKIEEEIKSVVKERA